MAGGERAVSLRWSLLRSFVVLILISSLIVLALTWIRSLETEKRLSSRLIRRGTDLTRRELDRFLAPATIGIEMALTWGRAGNLSLEAIVGGVPGAAPPERVALVRRLNGLLLPYVLAYPALSSVQVADGHGHGFLVLQMPDGSIRNRIVDRRAWGEQTLWFDVDREGVPTNAQWKAVDYEPRSRAWWTGCVAAPAGKVHWTEPYIFFTTKDLGITASGRWQAEGVDHVVAFDVLLTDLTRFTQDERSQVSANALTLIATEDWRSLGLPRLGAYLDPSVAATQFLRPVGDLESPVISAAVAAARQRESGSSPVFPFEGAGDDWWAGVDGYDLGPGRRVSIAILVPARDLLAEVAQQRLFLVIATAVALIAALVYSLLLARSYSRPLEALAAQSRRISALDFSTDEVIGARLKEFRELAAAQHQSLTALQSFSRYVPLEVVRQLVDADEVARIGGREVVLTLLFTDIKGFTSISERMPPQALTDHMAEYFEGMIRIVREHGGTVDKLVGDAIVAFWGAPQPMDDHAARAVRAVLACRRALAALNEAWQAQGRPALPTRFGLATGPVVVGNIGAPNRLAYTVIGDAANYASRLEGLNKVYRTTVLAGACARAAAGPGFAWRRVDRAMVVGRSAGEDVFEVLGEADEVPADVLEDARAYETAWDLYAERRFGEAAQSLAALCAARPQDAAARRLHELCVAYAKDPPPPDWDAVTRMVAK